MKRNNQTNNKKKSRLLLIFIACFMVIIGYSSCKKYLDPSPDKKLTTPKKIQDLRAILDYNSSMNSNYSPYGAIASDNYYVTDEVYDALTDVVAKNNYAWGLIDETADKYLDWQYNYQRMFYANVVIDYFDKVAKTGLSEADINTIRGEALFYRAFTMFTMAQVYALPYNQLTAESTPGIPYKVTSDINEPITRPSLQENYQQMAADLLEAISLLKASGQSFLCPDKPAAFLALANVYLVMQQFDKAEIFADSCLKYQNQLIDYNNISLSSAKPFELFNKEVIWQADLATNTILSSSRAFTDSLFYKSYENNDLRKAAFFNGGNSSPAIFKGYYNGKWKGVYFAGLAVDEAYLVSAECQARNGKTDVAMATLNSLLKNRYDSSFVPLSASSQQQAIHIILDQRRKELCFRNSRWMDIRRLNQFDNSKLTLMRNLKGTKYKLLPDDPHFAFLIPQNAIDNSHINQNRR
ncbi:MAG TPA: RagB/SusD family nutrient uptake outer membrane protein [Hanamia sp.]|nr:RagB/SusD family nutrient uptake outer membrane protein [Hanamia sp.]